jgi:hypothetical protein
VHLYVRMLLEQQMKDEMMGMMLMEMAEMLLEKLKMDIIASETLQQEQIVDPQFEETAFY